MTLTSDPTDASKLYIALRQGEVLLKDGSAAPTTVLDISSQVDTTNEGGLLGLALHPSFGTGSEDRFYVHYTGPKQGGGLQTYLSELRMSDTSSENVLFSVEQPAANHDGGDIHFGPDGYLYLGLGDGGAANDLFNNGQDASTPLGAILRFDVENHPTPPTGNVNGGHEYVFHWGLRNPYRFGFDSLNGDLYIADVGQDSFEEISAVPGGTGPENFGWPIQEGSSCRSQPCATDVLVQPIAEYSHQGQDELSVVGGVVYRGSAIPGLQGRYLYSDFYIDQLEGKPIWSLVWTGSEVCDEHELEYSGSVPAGLVDIAEDAAGELYFVSLFNGAIYRLDP